MKVMPLILLSLTAAVASVHAADNRPDMPGKPKSFAELDSDGSGYLTEDEVADDPFLADKFSELDTNSDGSLSESEFKKAAKGGPGNGKPPSFSDLDSNGDGEISESEAASDRFLSERFSELDSDGSGTLSEEEMRPPRR